MNNEATRALEEIRRAEMEAARHVEAARAEAAEMEEQARAEGRLLVAEGRKRGRQAAQERYESAIEEAMEAAAAVRAGGKAEERSRNQIAAQSMELLVEEMARALLAPPSEPGK